MCEETWVGHLILFIPSLVIMHHIVSDTAIRRLIRIGVSFTLVFVLLSSQFSGETS